jgi:2'-5' RNA ligase
MLPSAVQLQISHWLSQFPTLLATPGWRWQQPESWHVTLRFINHISQAQAQQFIKALTAQVQVPCFELTLTHCVWFPNAQDPKALALDLQPCPLLLDLVCQINQSLATFQFPADPRVFIPHLTLARTASAIHPLPDLPTEALNLTLPITHWQLMQSLTQPSGSKYQRLQQFSLSQPC